MRNDKSQMNSHFLVPNLYFLNLETKANAPQSILNAGSVLPGVGNQA